MKKLIILLAIIVTACQSTKINNEKYNTSDSFSELGSIGIMKRKLSKTGFSTRSFPILENKLRLDIQFMPFDKKTNSLYLSKAKNSSLKINYVDSLPNKPEYVTISLLDHTGYIQEINAASNQEIFTFIKDSKEAVCVTSVVMAVSEEDIAKIKQADAYYLINKLNRKYNIALYKQGKQTDMIDLQSGITLAYNVSKFCWGENDRHRWYIADLIGQDEKCLGNTEENIKEKEETNLFKM